MTCDEQDASVTVTASCVGPLESRAFTALSDKTPGDNQMRAKLEQQQKKKTSNRKRLSKIPDAVERNVISDGDAKTDSLSIPSTASEGLVPTKGGSAANEIVSRKRPRAKRESAYVLYCKEMRPQLLVEKPHLSKFLGQQSSELSRQWKALSQEERNIWKQRYEQSVGAGGVGPGEMNGARTEEGLEATSKKIR